MKKCKKCGLEKKESEFSKNKRNKNGLQHWCKDCSKEYSKAYNKTDKRKEYQREYKRKYAKTDKHKEYQKAYKQTDKCKEYNKEYNKAYRKSDKYKEWQRIYNKTDERKEYQRIYSKSDKFKKRKREYCKGYRQTDRYKEYKREYEKKRRLINPKLRLDGSMTTVIGRALKGKKAGRQWESLVGYTIEDLMKHLESKFEDWMNWDNYGKWHLDHIKPKSLFNYIEPEDKEFKECWALENLQPLEAMENLRKSNKIGWIKENQPKE